jgi:DNA invertase Pin-like site-specific DNA recombinase
MGKTVAYLRVSTDKQDLDNQRLEILEYARHHHLRVDEFIEVSMSSRKSSKQRRVDELLGKLANSDTLIVTELSRLGRSTSEVLTLVNELLQSQIRVIIIKQGLDIAQHNMQSKIIVTLFSLFAELERDLVSLRTREALAAKKARGVKLGKPKGTIQASKFDKDRNRIEELLGLGLSVRKIAKLLGYSNHVGLNTYVKKRKIREKLAHTGK